MAENEGPSALLRVDEFNRYARARKLTTDADRARAIGIHQSTLSRVLAGECRPGAKFITCTLAYFEVPFETLFELEKEEVGS